MLYWFHILFLVAVFEIFLATPCCWNILLNKAPRCTSSILPRQVRIIRLAKRRTRLVISLNASIASLVSDRLWRTYKNMQHKLNFLSRYVTFKERLENAKSTSVPTILATTKERKREKGKGASDFKQAEARTPSRFVSLLFATSDLQI